MREHHQILPMKYEKRSLDHQAMQRAKAIWDSVAMPLDGLGRLQTSLVQIAGIQGSERIHLNQPRLVVMCADNGIVAEGVSQSGQEVTALVADSIAEGKSPAALMAKSIDCQTQVVDVACAFDPKSSKVVRRNIRRSSRNFAREAAMTLEEVYKSIEIGLSLAKDAGREGVDLLLLGEMGIGNTTTSAACLAALCQISPTLVVGRGAGLEESSFQRKRTLVAQVLREEGLPGADPMRILCQVGGFDIAALVGLILGAREERIPVLMDGLITCVAALFAERLCPGTSDFFLASHQGREPGMKYALQALDKRAMIDADMALGEGTGALLALSLLQMALPIYQSKQSFDALGIAAYERKAK